MNGKPKCSSCGREFDQNYQFCPFDGTPLGTKCPSCGRMWDHSYRFCPLDSTPLSIAAAPKPLPAETTVTAPPGPSAPEPEPPPTRVYPPQSREEPVTRPQPLSTGPGPAASFTFIEQTAKSSWKTTLLRPVTWLFTLGVLVIGFAVWYLNFRNSGPDLPAPTISYTLLPNAGQTKGIPVAIKVNQLTVFLIDDPMDTPEGAARAKKIVAALDETIRPLSKGGGDVRFAVETVGGRPAIVVVTQNGPEPRPLAIVTEGDMVLAGETNGDRVAAAWAERLTDAVKVFVLGEAPSFSVNTDFGQALLAMYKAAVGPQGKLTKKSLDNAFEHLSAAQRRALEAPPMARRTSAQNRNSS